MIDTNKDLKVLWGQVMKLIETSPSCNKGVYDAFFKKTYFDSIENNKIIVGCETRMVSNVLKSTFKETFIDNILKASGTNYDCVFVPIDELKSTNRHDLLKNYEDVPYFKECNLNKDFTFDNFVVGHSNGEAQQASLYVAKTPGTLYNPLYIQGQSGLGKTHLLNAIANSIKETNPELKVLCISTQNFIEEYINFARKSLTDYNLTDYLKTFDVLLIDDIQLLKGKEKTTDFFFETYTYFLQNKKQVVLTSDKYQNELEDIPNRLITRFLSGLTVSIKKPDVSTCEQIIYKKLDGMNLPHDFLDGDVVSFIADKFKDSIRNLQGALMRLDFYSTFYKIPRFNMTTALEALQGLVDVNYAKNKIDENKIISIVANYYNISTSQLTGKIKTAQISTARQIAMYLIRTKLDIPYKKIGELFSNRDHSTCMHGCEKVEKLLKEDKQIQSVINDLLKEIE